MEHVRSALAGRYAIERELGSGGMATVYLADDVKHDRKVAVKVFREEVASALGNERFTREIQIAARLSHPHILPLFDLGTANGLTFYVMPYVAGESLRQKVTRERQERYVSPYHRAFVYVGLGEYEEALNLLERAYQERSGAVYNMKGSLLLAPLGSHPRFQALLRKMNLA